MIAIALLVAAPADAHVHLRSSSPADGDTLSAAPEEVRLVFSGAVVPEYTAATLTGPDGRRISTPDVRTVPETRQREFALPIDQPLRSGAYTVEWRTMAADGHIMEGSFSFTLDLAEEPESPVEEPLEEAPDELRPPETERLESSGPIATLVRFLHYGALLLLLGGVAFHYGVVGRMRREPRVAALTDRTRARNQILVGAGLALLVVVILARLWAQSAQLHGLGAATDGENIRRMLSLTTWGHAWLVQVGAAVVLLVGLLLARTGRSVGWALVAVAALALSVVLALSGHAAAVQGQTVLAVIVHALHVVGAGVWLGTLAVLLLVGLPVAAGAARGERMTSVAAVVSLFSPVALAGIAVAAVTGIANALFHLGAVADLWTTDYGLALLVKLGVLLLAAGLGFYHWRIVLPGLREAESPSRFRLTAGGELAFGVLVLLATAVLAGLPTPA